MKPEVKKGRATVDTEAKRKFIGDWAMANPLSTIREARDALRKEFGETLGTSYIAATLKTARQLVMEERNKRPGAQLTLPVSEPVTSLKKSLLDVARELGAAMKAAGIKYLRVNPDGTIDFEAAVSLS